MEERSVFEQKTHFDYLRLHLEKEGAPRGYKTRFADFVKIQPAYLSQVLGRKYALSLEQADLANQFFDHSQDEAEFFLLLVSLDRAGTASLRKHFESQIRSSLKKRMLVVERLGRRTEISHEAKGIYYSSWMYSAVHVACTVPALSTRKAMANAFHLAPETVGKVLSFLEENGLVQKTGDSYRASETWVRIDKTSPFVTKLHANWRNKAIQSLDSESERDLHYSGVFSIDAATALKIKDQLLEALQAQVKRCEQAKEEELFVMGVDFFRLA